MKIELFDLLLEELDGCCSLHHAALALSLEFGHSSSQLFFLIFMSFLEIHHGTFQIFNSVQPIFHFSLVPLYFFRMIFVFDLEFSFSHGQLQFELLNVLLIVFPDSIDNSLDPFPLILLHGQQPFLKPEKFNFTVFLACFIDRSEMIDLLKQPSNPSLMLFLLFQILSHQPLNLLTFEIKEGFEDIELLGEHPGDLCEGGIEGCEVCLLTGMELLPHPGNLLV
jgi:hypothetical protein